MDNKLETLEVDLPVAIEVIDVIDSIIKNAFSQEDKVARDASVLGGYINQIKSGKYGVPEEIDLIVPILETLFNEMKNNYAHELSDEFIDKLKGAQEILLKFC